MKTPDRVQKVNAAYVLGYIFIPPAVLVGSILVGWQFFRDSITGAVVCFAAIPLAVVCAWIFTARIVYHFEKKKMLRQLDEAGIDRRQIFYGDKCVVSVDMEQGKLGLIFFWNPFEVQVIPAERITKAWADDGAFGAGFTRGTSRVSFLFLLDGIKIRVNTFTSNHRWKMNDRRVLEGISKADRWVEVLNYARQRQEAEVQHGAD